MASAAFIVASTIVASTVLIVPIAVVLRALLWEFLIIVSLVGLMVRPTFIVYSLVARSHVGRRIMVVLTIEVMTVGGFTIDMILEVFTLRLTNGVIIVGDVIFVFGVVYTLTFNLIIVASITID